MIKTRQKLSPPNSALSTEPFTSAAAAFLVRQGVNNPDRFSQAGRENRVFKGQTPAEAVSKKARAKGSLRSVQSTTPTVSTKPFSDPVKERQQREELANPRRFSRYGGYLTPGLWPNTLQGFRTK